MSEHEGLDVRDECHRLLDKILEGDDASRTTQLKRQLSLLVDYHFSQKAPAASVALGDRFSENTQQHAMYDPGAGPPPLIEQVRPSAAVHVGYGPGLARLGPDSGAGSTQMVRMFIDALRQLEEAGYTIPGLQRVRPVIQAAAQAAERRGDEHDTERRDESGVPPGNDEGRSDHHVEG